MCNQSINIHQTHRCHHHCYHHHRMGFLAAETSHTLYRETVFGVVIVAAILTVATTVSNNQSMSSGGGSSSGVK